MQLEIGISTSRYLPASGTAGLERSLVSGKSREPCPPPIITASTLLMFGDIPLPCCAIRNSLRRHVRKRKHRLKRTGSARRAEPHLNAEGSWALMLLGAEGLSETPGQRETGERERGG